MHNFWKNIAIRAIKTLRQMRIMETLSGKDYSAALDEIQSTLDAAKTDIPHSNQGTK